MFHFPKPLTGAQFCPGAGRLHLPPEHEPQVQQVEAGQGPQDLLAARVQQGAAAPHPVRLTGQGHQEAKRSGRSRSGLCDMMTYPRCLEDKGSLLRRCASSKPARLG